MRGHQRHRYRKPAWIDPLLTFMVRRGVSGSSPEEGSFEQKNRPQNGGSFFVALTETEEHLPPKEALYSAEKHGNAHGWLEQAAPPTSAGAALAGSRAGDTL
jgi:hypothetical protein